jgi:hypothetical protein
VRVPAALALALIVPLITGLGLGGWSLVSEAVPRLGTTRAALAANARSAFDEPAPPKALPRPNDKPGALAIVAGTPRDKHISSGFSDLPSGLVNVTLRPYPWESSPNLSLLLARIEQVAWYVLYALGLVGLVACVRRPRIRLGLQYPLVLIALMTSIAAVTQGNLGTAFRHREQILWALALAAATGAEYLWARRRAAVAASVDSELEEPPRRAPVAARA